MDDKISGVGKDMLSQIAKWCDIKSLFQLRATCRVIRQALEGPLRIKIESYLLSKSPLTQWPRFIPGIGEIRQACASKGYASVVNTQGELFMIGTNPHGAFGHGDISSSDTLVKIDVDQGVCVKKVVLENTRSYLLDSERHLHTAGKAFQLGLKDRPRFLKQSMKMSDIAASGDSFVEIYMCSGQVWVRGSNARGQLGMSTQLCRRTDGRLLDNLPPMAAVAMGKAHTVLLSKKGQLYVSGDNTVGQLGLQDQNNRSRFTLVPNIENAVAVQAGENYTLYQDRKGIWHGAGDLSSLYDHGDQENQAQHDHFLPVTQHFSRSLIASYR